MQALCRKGRTMLDSWNRSDYEKHLNEAFVMEDEEGRRIDLTLLRVDGRGELERSFSLVLLGGDGACWPQRTYRLSHESGAAGELFIVPIGPDGGGKMRYEVVFNRDEG